MNTFFHQLKRKFRALVRRDRLDAEMSEEIRLHLELQTERNIAAGMDPREARYAAQRQFGGVEQIKETCREQRAGAWLQQSGRDVRQGVRQLRKSPGFTAAAVLTLALGIGGSSALFTVVNSVLLRPLDFPEPERLIALAEQNLPKFPTFPIAPANFRAWQKEADAFASMYVVQGTTMNLVGEGDPVRVLTARVTGQCFETLRVQPALGRVFGAEEDHPGKNAVVVLMHGFWQRQFGGRVNVIGESIRLNGRPYTIIGVMPEHFDRRGDYEIYTPAAFTDAAWNNRARFLSFGFGRLKPGATLEQARAQLDAIAGRLAIEHPDTNHGWGVRATRLLDFHVGAVRPTIYALFGAAAVLLLIGCANITHLVLVRASGRQREISVRMALGASRRRVAGQLLAEHGVLALLGGLLGLLFAKWGVQLLLGLAPADLPRAAEISLDWRAVGFASGLTVLTGLLFGLAPGWQVARANLVELLKTSHSVRSSSPRRRRFRDGIVVFQFALAVVLLTGAGLLVRSFVRLSRTDPGFRPEGAVMMWVAAPQYNSPAKQLAFADALTERVRALTGVTAVGLTPVMPFSGNYSLPPLEIEGRAAEPQARPQTVYYNVTPEYFRAMGIPLLRGRGFTAQDREGSPRVAIISQSLAERFFPGEDPLGKRINIENGPPAWREIVGIVGDVRHNGFEADLIPQTYEPFAQRPAPVMTMIVRASGDLGVLATALRRELRAVDPAQPVFQLDPLEQLVARSVARQRFAMILTVTFATVALALAGLGIYGVVAYSVAERTGEFGVRLALGATGADLRRLVLGDGAGLIAAGVVFGAAGAWIATQFIQSMLYQTEPREPLVFAAITILLGSVGLAACWLPARRAARVDPMVALRWE